MLKLPTLKFMSKLKQIPPQQLILMENVMRIVSNSSFTIPKIAKSKAFEFCKFQKMIPSVLLCLKKIWKRYNGNSFYSPTEVSGQYIFLIEGKKYDYFYDFSFIFASGFAQKNFDEWSDIIL